MKYTVTLLAAAALLCSGCARHYFIDVMNSSALDRQEIVEADLHALELAGGKQPFRLADSRGQEIPYQITHDGKILFPLAVKANSMESVRVSHATPSAVDTIACGAFYPARKDDLAWENDRSAYRAYGPALQQSGERAYGFDIWTKSVAHPVVMQRYADTFTRGISFHEDHGNGMDVYNVGPTLGGGTPAFIDKEGNIVYPWCFSDYEILDNGPLRFSVRLGYSNGETRLITLDAGEYLNKTVVSFPGCPYPEVAPGIVVHRQNPEKYKLSPEKGYMAYADLTDNADKGNGVIFIGIVAPDADSMQYVPLDTPRGDAVGHILARKSFRPGDDFVYYWGSGWSKGDMPDWQTWHQYLADFGVRLKNPLTVTVR